MHCARTIASFGVSPSTAGLIVTRLAYATGGRETVTAVGVAVALVALGAWAREQVAHRAPALTTAERQTTWSSPTPTP